MDGNLIVLLIIVGCASFFVGAGLFAALAINKNWNVEGALNTTKVFIKGAKEMDNLIDGFIPEHLANIIDKVLFYAEKAVFGAEQLYKIGSLKGDERKNVAFEFVTDALKSQNVEITDNVRRMIDLSIEGSVLALKKIPMTSDKEPINVVIN